MTAGIAAVPAAPPPPANADPVPMAAQIYDKVSRDGWHMQIRIDNETINSVPNLAEASNSREGFVTASGTATVSGGASPITDSIFILGYQLGCQSDVSTGLQFGGTAGIAPLGSVGVGGSGGGAVGQQSDGGVVGEGFEQSVGGGFGRRRCGGRGHRLRSSIRRRPGSARWVLISPRVPGSSTMQLRAR
ncbi:MspA family porin, partial [Mycolicibacterium insubricum]|uniref:MspA family porin n=1 Tax=Mycolicibacterium insubricum TaxID=444597 RepID=UPI0021F3A1A7